MDTKEKAKELVDKFTDGNYFETVDRIDAAKHNALILVNKMIEEYEDLICVNHAIKYNNRLKHWKKVKQEIEKL